MKRGVESRAGRRMIVIVGGPEEPATQVVLRKDLPELWKNSKEFKEIVEEIKEREGWK